MNEFINNVVIIANNNNIGIIIHIEPIKIDKSIVDSLSIIYSCGMSNHTKVQYVKNATLIALKM